MTWSTWLPWTEDKNTRHAWGHSFQWTSAHPTREDMEPWKHSYDNLAEDCLNRLDIISPPVNNELPRNKPRGGAEAEKLATPPKRDLYALLRDHAHEDEKLGEMWHQINYVPDWVDWAQISRGQEVFYRYAGPNLTALTFQSLLGGMAAARVVETLARTGGFGVKVARHRMYETTQHLLQVTRSLDSVKPGGDGFVSSVRVRLLHAAVRRRIMKLAAAKPEYYNVEEWGVPINDLDSMGTIISFSAALIWYSLPRQGIYLRKQEIVDYLALWRYVAYIMGCPDDQFETPEKFKCFMESLLLFEIDPSKISKALANNIILSLQDRPPTYASRQFLEASARWLNGNELADALDIGRPGIYYSALVAGQCLFLMLFCYTYRSIPYLDRWKIKTFRSAMYRVIVEKEEAGGLGKESSFDFKYIPDFHTETPQGDISDSPSFKPSGVEARSLGVLLAAVGVVGMGVWYSSSFLLNQIA